MGWHAKGDDRVKSYRLYQELERNYHAALTDLEAMKTAIRIKDELIRRLAAEIAMLPNKEEHAPQPGGDAVDNLRLTAADAWAKNAESGSGEVRRVTPGGYSLVVDTEAPPKSVRKGRTGS